MAALCMWTFKILNLNDQLPEVSHDHPDWVDPWRCLTLLLLLWIPRGAGGGDCGGLRTRLLTLVELFLVLLTLLTESSGMVNNTTILMSFDCMLPHQSTGKATTNGVMVVTIVRQRIYIAKSRHT